jgi:hypothetical protein
MTPFEVIMYVLGLSSYVVMMNLYALAASRRCAHRTGRRLSTSAALLLAVFWPLWMVLWVLGCFIARTPLPSPFWEPSAADRAAAAMDRRKEERSLAIQGWQARASFWFDLGQKAEAEDDQALKWLVADNLNFLLETKPEGAKVKGLTAPETSSKTGDETPRDEFQKALQATAEQVRECYSVPPNQLKGSQLRIKKRNVPSLYDDVARIVQPDESSTVGFCNICSRYRTRDRLMMEGVCDECSEEQGLLD